MKFPGPLPPDQEARLRQAALWAVLVVAVLMLATCAVRVGVVLWALHSVGQTMQDFGAEMDKQLRRDMERIQRQSQRTP